MTKLFALFILLFSFQATAQFLLVKGVSDTSFPKGTGPYGSGGTLTGGDVVVASGQTLSLAAGTAYDFNSITINSGGTVRITGHGIVILGSKGNIVNNGTIVSDPSSDVACTQNFTVLEPISGTTYNYTYTYSAGFTSGRGGGGAFVAASGYRSIFGAPGGGGFGANCGNGSGGGGGAAVAASDACSSNCISRNVQYSGDDAASSTNSTKGNGGNASGPTAGLGGGAAGGAGDDKDATHRGGGGGGGGFHGGSASSLVIKTKGSITGTGTIVLAGQNGFNGGNGGNGTNGTAAMPAGGGGGGGGGMGGFGGKLWIYYKSGSAYPTGQINLAGGAAGLGGNAGTSTGQAGYDGDPGSPGTAGTAGTIQANTSW